MDLAAFQHALHPVGLNLFAITSTAVWDDSALPARRSDALLPGSRSILLVGNGGRALWSAFLQELDQRPAALTEERHPLDAFVRRQIERADPLLGHSQRRWFWASAEAELHIDFRLLAGLAGLGGQSRLGLLLHPVYGPWLGLRAACFLDADIRDLALQGPLGADLPSPEYPGSPEYPRSPEYPPAEADPCAGCAAPCIAACPGSAFPGGRWAVDPCVEFHTRSTHCADRCDARLACPVGQTHRYSEDQLRYHYNRLAGRHALRARLKLPEGEDPFEGDGPHWGSWRQRVDAKGLGPEKEAPRRRGDGETVDGDTAPE